MKNNNRKIQLNKGPLPCKRHKGAALLLTIAVLVILTTLVFSLVLRLKIHTRRQRYKINYQVARYACDSAMKYALTKAKDIKPELIDRKDKPDFSDLFFLNYQQQQEMLQQWAQIKTQQIQEEGLHNDQSLMDGQDPLNAILGSFGQNNDPNGFSNDPNSSGLFKKIDPDTGLKLTEDGMVDPNSLTIPGPYGPDWPYISEPAQLQIGDAEVTVKIIDENAKLPLTLALIKDPKLQRASTDAVYTFCQWMRMDDLNIESLFAQLDQVKKIKPYTRDPEKTPADKKTPEIEPTKTPKTKTAAKQKTRSAAAHTGDFARLLHSSLIDSSVLSIPLPETGKRHETPLKYLALWGSEKVNINTAPRHVLEAVFTFGGDSAEIAETIIQQRKVEPFKSIDDFKNKNYGFSDSIRKVEPYIVTQSSFFSIEVKAVCGNAIVSSIAAVRVKNGKAQNIAIISN